MCGLSLYARNAVIGKLFTASGPHHSRACDNKLDLTYMFFNVIDTGAGQWFIGRKNTLRSTLVFFPHVSPPVIKKSLTDRITCTVLQKSKIQPWDFNH